MKLLNLLSANDIGSIFMNGTTISDEEETINGIPVTRKGTNSIWISIFLHSERPKKFAVEASPFACGVKLSWKTPNSGGCPITQYTVHYKESRDPVTEASSIWQVQNLNNTDRHNLMTDCNKEYKIIVLAWNERGHSDFDEESVLTVFTDKGIIL